MSEKINELRKLESICQEADRLLSRNDSFHDMHGCRAAIYAWKYLYEQYEDMKVDWDGVNWLITAMRWTDNNGHWPSHDELKRRKIN